MEGVAGFAAFQPLAGGVDLTKLRHTQGLGHERQRAVVRGDEKLSGLRPHHHAAPVRADAVLQAEVRLEHQRRPGRLH